MYVLDKIKQEISREINNVLKKGIIDVSDLVYPPRTEMGDLSLPLFNEKKIGCSAEELFKKLAELKNDDWQINLAGKFLNFKIKKEYLADGVIKQILELGDEYGRNRISKRRRVMIEYSNANTHKEYHVGHLRNICYGDAVYRILSANGQDVIPVSYINDFGIHVAKTLWAYLEFFKDEPLSENKGEFLGHIYVEATKKIEKNPLAKQMVELIMKKVESRQGEEYKLWEKTRQWSIAQFDNIYQELGVKFEKIFYESEFINQGREEVQELLKKGILKKSQGAVIADLEKYGLGVLIVLRSDNTAAYPVADISLAKGKFKKFKLDESIYVVDKRQSLYFKQLFKILSLMGYKQKMKHLGYDFVKLPGGMMSSRRGNVITYAELKKEMFARAESETKKRHFGWANSKIKIVAEKIAIGAMKFEMLKIGAEQEIVFDIEKSLEFNGFTAAYLQYAVARINSIVKKGEVKNIDNFKLKTKNNLNNLKTGKEHDLILELAKYPQAVARAAKKYEPAEIAKYLFELARIFNDYYHKTPILKSEEKIKEARLALILAINQVLKNGLNLLGIEAVNKM